MQNEIIKSNVTSQRSNQVAKEIKNILSGYFSRGNIKDPALFDRVLIVSEVVITKDLSMAKIFLAPWSMQGVDAKVIIKAINKQIPLLRKKIAKALHIKVIPNLSFIIDEQFDRLDQVSELFKKINIPND